MAEAAKKDGKNNGDGRGNIGSRETKAFSPAYCALFGVCRLARSGDRCLDGCNHRRSNSG